MISSSQFIMSLFLILIYFGPYNLLNDVKAEIVYFPVLQLSSIIKAHLILTFINLSV